MQDDAACTPNVEKCWPRPPSSPGWGDDLQGDSSLATTLKEGPMNQTVYAELKRIAGSKGVTDYTAIGQMIGPDMGNQDSFL